MSCVHVGGWVSLPITTTLAGPASPPDGRLPPVGDVPAIFVISRLHSIRSPNNGKRECGYMLYNRILTRNELVEALIIG